jgi:REP element-mobilizing transposase RayT
MSFYNPEIHHRKSIRLKGYDYSQEGLYFITICCQDRKYRFGEVILNDNGIAEMQLNPCGKIAFNEWYFTAKLRPNIELDAFVVMPNHIHGIINITRRVELHSTKNELNSIRDKLHSTKNDSSTILRIDDESESNKLDSSMIESNKFDSGNRVECNSTLRGPSQTIGAIVRGYKSSVTKQSKILGVDEKIWQRNYYEHIIRDENSYKRIADYIVNNPTNWIQDKFHS